MNTKQDLINQYNKVQAEADKLLEKISQMPDEDLILVPENIHLYDGSRILFNNDQQTLFICRKMYQVFNGVAGKYTHEPHKLILCDKDNLEIGKIYYHSNEELNDEELNDIEYLEYYGIYDGSGFRYVYNDDEIRSSNPDYSTILQAVPVED